MLQFNAEKYLAKNYKDKVYIDENDFDEVERDLVELVNKNGELNNIEYQVSTGVVNNNDCLVLKV